MSDQELLDRAELAARRVALPEDRFEELLRRRDRRRRNKRIAAGVVGIAVFVAAAWIVTTGGPFDRTQTPVAPGPTETGPMETAPPPTPTSLGRPPPPTYWGRQEMCSDGARSRMELTDEGTLIKVRFEVHRSPAGHSWRIDLRHDSGAIPGAFSWDSFFSGTRVASDSGGLAVKVLFGEADAYAVDVFNARAVDVQTGQVCRLPAVWGARFA